jgi:hypothetical protein
MSFVPAVVVLFFLGAAAVLAVIVGLVVLIARSKDDVVGRARGRIRVLYGVAALVGIGFAFLVAMLFPTVFVNSTRVPGLLAALGPSLAGLVYVGVAALGEATWSKPEGEQRGAYLNRRPALANAARAPMSMGVAWGGLLLGSTVLFGILAAKDGDSPGRSIAHVGNDAVVQGWSGPFPGWPYGVPMAIAAVVLLLATAGVLHVIARRPAISAIVPESDEILRRISASNLIKGVQLSLATSLAGLLFIAGMTARNAGWSWGTPSCWAAVLVAVLSLAVLAWRVR